MATGNGAYRLDEATRRLLPLAARGAWDDVQRDTAARLARDVADWNTFCDVATRSLGVCLSYRLFLTLPESVVPAQVLGRMQQASRMFAMYSLQIEAGQLDFMADCLAPLGVRHAFFKGAALAHRYHAVPAARPCRDVDVLVDPDMAFDILRHACSLGYVPVQGIGTSERELAAWLKRETVYGVRAPNGVLVEIHQSLDHGDGRLDVGRLLSRAEGIDFRGRTLPVLHTSDLFVYMCMHHTRHFWSHLHWYADLDAIIGHPLFDLAEVRGFAGDVGLSSTVEACLQLNGYARTGDWPGTLSLDRGAGEALLARSIECLEGGPEHEVELRAERLSADRAFAWQSTHGERVVLFANRIRHRIRKQSLRAWNFLARHARAVLQASATK